MVNSVENKEQKYVCIPVGIHDSALDEWIESIFNRHSGKIPVEHLESELHNRFGFNPVHVIGEKEMREFVEKFSDKDRIYKLDGGFVSKESRIYKSVNSNQ